MVYFAIKIQPAFPVEEKQGNPVLLTTNASYDFNTGLIKTATDENNQTTTVTYDATTLRQTRIDRPDGGYTTFEYNDTLVQNPDSSHLNSFIKTTTALDSGRTVSGWAYFDGRGATVRTFGALTSQGHIGVTDVEYDVMGRVKRTSNPYYASGAGAAINPSGKWTTATYDKLGRATVITTADNQTIQYSYNGTITTFTDQAGKQRRQEVDALGRMVRLDEPDTSGNLGSTSAPAQPTYYEYDTLNNLTKITQSANSIIQERLFKYDSLSRLTHERQPEMNATLNDAGQKVASGGLWTGVRVYDTNGLLTDSYDAKGVRSQFTYDSLKRLKTITYSGEANYQTPTVTYNYDEERTGYFNKGNLTSIATSATSYSPSTTLVYDFDKLGRAVKQQQTIGANGSIAAQTYTLEYGYNLGGQLVKKQYPSGRAVNISYDDAGRVANIYGGGRTYSSNFSYAGHGGLLSMGYGNGAVESFSYNDRLQLEQQSLTKNSQIIQRFDYAYGEVDQSTGIVDATKNTGQIARIESYVANAQGQTERIWQQRFSYDSISRLSQVSEYESNAQGNLTQSYRMQFDYDRWGNRYRKVANNPQSLPFIAIEDNDVAKSTNRFVSTTGIAYDETGQVTTDNKFRNLSFRYDANGRQIWTQNSNGQGSENKAVYDGKGDRVATLVDGVWRYMVYDLGGNLIAEYGHASTDTNKIRFYMQDYQGTTRTVMKNDASIISRVDYQAFGEEIGSSVGRRASILGYGTSDNNRQRYAMTERDDATGLDHTWARKYDNKAGRWTSPDPYKGSMKIADPQSFNRFSYVENDPVNYLDPNGLDPIAYLIDGISFGISGFSYGPNGVDGGYHGSLSLIIMYIRADEDHDYQIIGSIVFLVGWVSSVFGGRPSPQGQRQQQQRQCPVAPLTPITDSVAQRFERGGGNEIDTEHLTQGTRDALSCLQGRISGAGGTANVTSAYRPQAYQDHLREVWDKWQLLRNNEQPECQQVRQQVQAEINRHGITERPAARSNHSDGTAFDVSIRNVNNTQINTFAGECNLSRGNVHAGGGHHFNFIGQEPRR